MAISSPFEKSMVIPPDPVWRLSVAQYHDMIDAGILTEDDPVELLEGWLITKMPKNRRHSLSTQLMREALAGAIPSGWYVDDQEPITTADSEPEPDVMVVRGNRRDYTTRHPYPEEIALVTEVSDATLQRDRTLKLHLYASARIPIYWILNLQDRQLEVHTSPTGNNEQASYQRRVVLAETDQVEVLIEGKVVAQLPIAQFFA